MVSRPTFSARMTKPPLRLIVPPMTLAPTSLLDRHRLAGHHRFVERRAPLDQLAVDRHLVARAAPAADRRPRRRRARPPRRRRSVTLMRGLRRQVEQRADRAGGLLAGAQLQHLAEQHQHGDDSRRLEIDRDRAVGAAKCRRKQAGRERRDDAVDPRHAGAERDQREHVEIAADDRLRAAHEERPARPQYDWRGERRVAPIRDQRR